VKRTELGGKDRKIDEIKDFLENGIKETNPHFLEILNPMTFEPNIKEMKRMNEVNIVLGEGIKEVKELPDKSGELRGYGDYYNTQEDRTKPHTQYVDDVVLNGIKETKSVHIFNGESIESVIQDGIKETWGYEKQPQIRVNEVIHQGIKETNWRKVDNFPEFVDRVIKKG